MRFISRFISLLVVVVVSLTFPSEARPIEVGSLDGRIGISGRIAIAEEVDPAVTLDQVMQPDSKIVFHPNPATMFHGSGQSGDIWIKADLVNSSDTALRGNLVIRFPYLEVVDAYIVGPQGVEHQGRAGATVARSGIAIPDPFPTFEVDVPAQASRTLYLRVHSNTVVVLSMWLHSSADFQLWSKGSIALKFLMIGIICTFTLYALSVARTSQHHAYRLYVGFCLSSVLYVLFSAGIGKAFFWPNSDIRMMDLVTALQASSTAFGGLFIASFLNIRSRWPAFHAVIMLVAALCVVSVLISVMPAPVATALYMLISIIGPVIVLGGVWVLHRRGVDGAGVVLLAWSPSILATVWMYLRIFDITPYFEINHYLVPFALCLTVLQFSSAISNRVKAAEASAVTDPLTGLFNRRKLDSAFDGPKQRTEPPCSAVLAIDLDGFKEINDTYGHEAGDAVLRVIGQRLTKLSLGRAKSFRTGGDEFVVLYSEQDERAEIQAFGNHCIARIGRPILFGTEVLFVGASVGIAFVQDDEEFRTGIQRADAALYRAKRDGKGIVRLYDERQPPISNEPFRPAVVR
jgi:diguanylate cyclase (GGDEF)-like protein